MMSSLEDFIFLTEMLFHWHAQHKISTESNLLSNVINLLNLGHEHLIPPNNVLKPKCAPSKNILLSKMIAAFLRVSQLFLPIFTSRWICCGSNLIFGLKFFKPV